MYKKLFGSLILVCSLMFVSCEQDNAKKDKKTNSRSYHRNSYKSDRDKSTMPTKCPKDKPCPPPAKKSCPNGCKKKCCVNEKDQTKEDLAIQEMQETISINEIKPLEDLKASLEKSNALDELGSELE